MSEFKSLSYRCPWVNWDFPDLGRGIPATDRNKKTQFPNGYQRPCKSNHNLLMLPTSHSHSFGRSMPGFGGSTCFCNQHNIIVDQHNLLWTNECFQLICTKLGWINTTFWWISTTKLWINTTKLLDQHNILRDQHNILVDRHRINTQLWWISTELWWINTNFSWISRHVW